LELDLVFAAFAAFAAAPFFKNGNFSRVGILPFFFRPLSTRTQIQQKDTP
jgi:hypothetical protein